MSLLRDLKLMDLSAATSRPSLNLKRNRRSFISSGLRSRKLNALWTELLVCISMANNPKPVPLPPSGLIPLFRIPGIKSFPPKDFPTSHKVPSTLPKCWELHEDSPIMLKPPNSIAIDQVPDTEITTCSSWLEAFAARSSHSATISSTSLEAVYNFLQKVIIFLRSSFAKDTIKNDASVSDDLLQRVNSTILEAQLMSHDVGVTATELYTHLHILQRRTVLDSPAVDLPQRIRTTFWSCL